MFRLVPFTLSLSSRPPLSGVRQRASHQCAWHSILAWCHVFFILIMVGDTNFFLGVTVFLPSEKATLHFEIPIQPALK